MLEYFILTIYILLICLIRFRNLKLKLLLCFIPFFIFIATRVGWTADYYNYENMFLEQHDWSWTDYVFYSFNKFEPGFFFLIKTLPSYRALLVVVSLIYTSSIFLLFYKYIPEKYYFLAFFLWFYNPTFFESIAAVRSTIVLAFFIYAVHLKINRKIIFSIILILISGLFHRSGFLLLPLLLIPLDFIKKHFTITTLSFIFVTGIILLAPEILINKLVDILSDSSVSSYTNYIEESRIGLGYILKTLLRILFVVYFLILINKGIIESKYTWLVFIAFFSYLIITIPNIQIGYRFNIYLNPLIILLQIYILSRDKSIFSKLYIALSIVIMLFYFSSFFKHPNYIPYFLNYNSSLFF